MGLEQGPRPYVTEVRWELGHMDGFMSLRGWGFLTSARAGHEVVSDIQRVPRVHLSRDRVEAQELVALEAVVAAEPSNGRGAVPNGWPVTLLCGFCGQVPEPRVGTFVQSINKYLVRPAYSPLCACTGLQGGPDAVPHGAHGPAGWTRCSPAWSSRPSRDTDEESDHTIRFHSKVHMIISASGVERIRENSPEKVALKMKSEAGVADKRGDRTSERGKPEAWRDAGVRGTAESFWSLTCELRYDESRGWRVNRDLVMESLVCTTEEHRFVLRIMGGQ